MGDITYGGASEVVTTMSISDRGTIQRISAFPAPQLHTTRDLFIYLPPGYDATTERYPVLYMHDGQNIFDLGLCPFGTWGVEHSLDALQATEPWARLIVVGIANGGVRRADEYIPWPMPVGLGGQVPGFGGQAAAYVDFLVQTVKPFIDANYRTLPDRAHTGVAGSSLGGLVSVYAGLKYQEVFGLIGAFSPIFRWGEEGESLLRFVRETPPREAMRIYVDIGEQETDFVGCVEDNRRLYQALLDAGYATADVTLVIDPAGEHNEAAWQRRFPATMRWLLS